MSRLTDLDGCIHHETDGAILFSLDGDADSAEWIPKSVVEINSHDEVSGKANITIPERMAVDKGLV